jgi:hypothetical protein
MENYFEVAGNLDELGTPVFVWDVVLAENT